MDSKKSFFFKIEDMKACLSTDRNDQEERKDIIMQKTDCGINYSIKFLRMEG